VTASRSSPVIACQRAPASIFARRFARIFARCTAFVVVRL